MVAKKCRKIVPIGPVCVGRDGSWARGNRPSNAARWPSGAAPGTHARDSEIQTHGYVRNTFRGRRPHRVQCPELFQRPSQPVKHHFWHRKRLSENWLFICHGCKFWLGGIFDLVARTNFRTLKAGF